MLQGFLVVVSAAPIPLSDAAGEDALDGASVESAHDGCIALMRDLLASVCGGSKGVAVLTLPVTQCLWSRR